MKDEKIAQLVEFGIRLERLFSWFKVYLNIDQQQNLFSEWGMNDACRDDLGKIADVMHEIANYLTAFTTLSTADIHGSELSPAGRYVLAWAKNKAVHDNGWVRASDVVPKLNLMRATILHVDVGCADQKNVEGACQLVKELIDYSS